MSEDMSQSSNHACAACKHQRRKCDEKCIFAPFFPSNKSGNFKEVHKIFGVKNASNILGKLNPPERAMAVESLEWEAFSWEKDKIRGPLGLYRALEEERELLKTEYQRLKTEHELLLQNQHQGDYNQINNHSYSNNTNYPHHIIRSSSLVGNEIRPNIPASSNSNNFGANLGYGNNHNPNLTMLNPNRGLGPNLGNNQNQHLNYSNYPAPDRFLEQERGADGGVQVPAILPKLEQLINQFPNSYCNPGYCFNEGVQSGIPGARENGGDGRNFDATGFRGRVWH